MPTPYVKKMAEKHGKSLDFMENKWQEAKAAVGSEHTAPGYWSTVMKVFNNMIGEKGLAEFEDFIGVSIE